MKSQKAANKAKAKSDLVSFTDLAWEDYLYWQDADQKILKAINNLLEECRRTPFSGSGKPEPLKGNLSGYWSRRITREHRLVYMYEADVLTLIQCRYRYEK
ncbi:Txe/YoeB family addiction module toxin [Massilia sp. W12]|uniref:Txe/YoeB family addiction module toxin n=1 Tax=Massilia sp. W12 TaxID=3126507 RepID=UPI0030CE0405